MEILDSGMRDGAPVLVLGLGGLAPREWNLSYLCASVDTVTVS
jgi:hypothetical protein